MNSPAVVAPTPDPNELTPEEIAEFDAMEKAAASGQTDTVAPAAPVPASVPTPAPVSAPAAAPVANPAPALAVAAAPAPAESPVPEPVANPDELTPAEEAEFDALEAAEKAAHPEPASDNIAEALTAEELAEMAIKDPTFDMGVEFRQNVPPRPNNASLAESQKYNALLQKFADARQILRARGFTWEDAPSLGQVAGSVKGFVEGIGKYATPFIKGAGQLLWDTENQDFSETQRGIAEAGAASEASVGGLADLATQTRAKLRRKIGLSKPLSEWTADDRVRAFTDELRRGEASEKVLKGEGPFMQSIGEHVIADLAAKGLPIRPEEVAAKSMGDPVALWAFGTGMKAIGGLTPRFVKVGLAKATAGAANIVPKIVGGGIKLASETAKLGAKIVEKTAPVITPIIGTVKGASMGGLPGAVGGFFTGKAVGAGFTKTARTVGKVAEKGTTFGEQVSGKVPMVSDYAQLVRSTAQAVPGMVAATGEGLLFDVGLAAVSSESPAETRGAIGVGTALGAFGGLGHLGKKIVSGQYLAPRAYGIDKPVPTSRQALDVFVAMHNAAWAEKTPAERANINATRKFMEEAVGKEAKDADLFVGKDAAAVKEALLAVKSPDGKTSLVSEKQAEDLSKAAGFFEVKLPGKDGKVRKIIIVRDVSAAPHESFHGVQDVLGEKANRVLDQIIMDSYGAEIDQIGHNYVSGFGKIPEGKTWEEVLLNKSRWGRVELIDKMTRELTESNEKQGNPPNPELITRLVMQEIAALEAKKGGDPSEIWNGELSAEEAKVIANRYILREIAAETFDTVFKSKGASLKEGNTLPAKLARVVAALISGLGGNPFDTVFSERQGIQMRPEVVKAVTEAARGQLPAKPGEPIVTPKTPPSSPVGRPGAPGKGIPATPEQIEEAAAEARQVAAAAPDVVEPGKSASPRELLGTVAEAIASRFGIKLNYRSATDAAVGGEPAGSPISNRSARRAVVEAFRSMPEAARALWEKNFFPERVVLTKGGKYQISGWAPEVFAANAHKIAKALIDARKGDLAPYPLDPTTGSFTQEGWQRLYEDTQTFVENQMAGRTGSGEELVVPRTVVDAGGYKPPVTGEAKPLEQGAADFINMLFNFRIPDTPRIVTGKRPLNIVGQEVSEATIPGRTKTVPGRDVFGGQEAVAQDIVGREIKEVNPVRGAIEAALGNQMPSFNDVRQNLNLEHINDVTVTPEQPQFRGNTLTLSAGMQAPRGKGYAADEMWLGRDKLNSAPSGHKKWAEQNFPATEGSTLTPYERAEQAGYLRTIRQFGALSVDASTKYPTWESVPRKYKDALEARAIDEDARVTFNGREVIKKFRPSERGGGDEGGMQFQPASESPVQDVAREYAKKAGIEYAPKGGVRSPDEGMLRNIADLYEAAKHAPDDPTVRASYDALANETVAQYEAIKDAGYTIEPWTEAGEPYKSSADMAKDVKENKHLFYRQSEGTFQGAEDNLMLQDSGVKINDQPVNVNDIFRAVHDFFGHAKEDYQFGPRGEFSAWRAHADMYSPEAQGALAAETLAQNAWVNYGPQLRKEGGKIPKSGETGFVAPPNRPFAEQKNFVVPDEMIELGKTQMQSPSMKGKPTKEAVDEILAMPAAAWTSFMREYTGEHSNSATGIAMDIGKLAKTPEDILALKVGADMAGERYKEARAAGDLDTAMAEAMRKQTFSEAVQAAERSSPALNELMDKTQMQAPKKGYVADELWLGRDKLHPTPDGHLNWAMDKFPDKDNAPETYRDQDSYERAGAAGYLRAVRAGPILHVDPSSKYKKWADVPRPYKEHLEDFAADHNLEVRFSGVTVIDRPGRGEGGTQMQAPKIPDDRQVKQALSTDKIPFIGAHRDLEEGTPIGVRIDIPAFTRNGEYVQTVHEAKTGGTVGKRIGYDGIVTLDDPIFFSNETGAEKIRAGAAKFPIATVEGKYNPSRKIPRNLKDWTEVGYNPRVHSYFYEKGTDELVTGGSKAVSVGNSVFVKDATFGDKSTAQFQLGKPTSTEPQTAAGKELQKKGWGFEFYTASGGEVEREAGLARHTIRLSHKGKADAAVIAASLLDPGEASINWVRVNEDLQKQGAGEALYREMAHILQQDGVTRLVGELIAPEPASARRKLFGEPTVTRGSGVEGQAFPQTVESRIDPNVQYQPMAAEDIVPTMPRSAPKVAISSRQDEE